MMGGLNNWWMKNFLSPQLYITAPEQYIVTVQYIKGITFLIKGITFLTKVIDVWQNVWYDSKCTSL